MAWGGKGIGCGCCRTTPPPGPCTVDLNVTDCGGAGVAGADVTLRDSAGTTLATGTTDGSGDYSITFSSGACPQTIVVSYGGATYTASLLYTSGMATVALMYGTGTVTASILDYDSGATVATHATTINYLGPRISPDSTGGIPLGFWTIPGWSYDAQGTSTGSTAFNFLGDDSTYYRVCGPNFALYCGDARTLTFRACSTATWNMAPCQTCGTDAAGNRVGAIPKTLHATFTDPAGTLGTDNGVALPLVWDSTSWDGDSFNPIYDGLGHPKPCIYRAVRPANGTVYLCSEVPNDPSDPPGSTSTVPFQSAVASLAWRYAGAGAACFCTPALSYTLHEGTYGTPTQDTPACPAPIPGYHYVAGAYPYPPYCVVFPGTNAQGQPVTVGLNYPRSIVFGVPIHLLDQNLAMPGTNPCGTFTAPADLEGVSSADCPGYIFAGGGNNGASGWVSCCPSSYDPTYGLAASAIVTE